MDTSTLFQIELPSRRIGGRWSRVHSSQFGPEYFQQRAAGRWTAPGGEFGVHYVARPPWIAMLESMPGVEGAARARMIPESWLAGRSLSQCHLHDLQVVDLSGAGLQRLGLDLHAITGPHADTRAWSLAFFLHPSRPEGILYRSRADPEGLCLALYDRARPKVRYSRGPRPLTELPEVPDWLARYHFTIFPDLDDSGSG